MNSNSTSNKNFDNLLSKIKIKTKTEVLSLYFSKIITQLKEKDSETISFLSFYHYIGLPYIIAEKLFSSFNISNDTTLECNSFIHSMVSLYKGTIETKAKMLFIFLDTKKEGKILKSNCKLLFNHFCLTSRTLDQSIGELIIENFFAKFSSFSYGQYIQKITSQNSDFFYLFYYLIIINKPFTNESIKYYDKHFYYNRKEQNEDVDNKEIEKLVLPSSELYSFLDIDCISEIDELSNFEDDIVCCLDTFYQDEQISKKLCNKFLRLNRGKSNTVNNKEFKMQRKEGCVELNRFNFYFDDNNSKSVDSSSIIKKHHTEIITFNNNLKEKDIKFSSSFKISNNVSYKIEIIGNDIYIFERDRINKNLLELNNIIPIREMYLIQDESSNNIVSLNMWITCKQQKINMEFENAAIAKSFIQIVNEIKGTKRVSDYYKILSIIGSGAFGSVVKAKKIDTGNYVAIKVVSKQYHNKELMHSIRQEQDILKYLIRHPHRNIITTNEILENQKEILLVQEYIENGTLEDYIKSLSEDENQKCNKIVDREINDIMLQLVDGINFYSLHGIIHRDLKPQNIMINKKENSIEVKIIDFGFSKVVCSNEAISGKYGTLLFLAPEIIQKEAYTSSIDVWAFGLILYFIIYGTNPFNHGSYMTIVNNILSSQINYPEDSIVNEGNANRVKRIIMECLRKDISSRPKINQLVYIVKKALIERA